MLFPFLCVSPSARFTDDSVSRAAPRSQVGRGDDHPSTFSPHPKRTLPSPEIAGLMIRGLLTIGFTPICWNCWCHGSSNFPVGWFQICFYFHPENWERFPFWLIFFNWVGSTTSQLTVGFPNLLELARPWIQFHWNVVICDFPVGGLMQTVLILIPKFGEMIQFDKHIFQMVWDHQLEYVPPLKLT